MDTTASFTFPQPATYFFAIRKDSTASANLLDNQSGGGGGRHAVFGSTAVQLFADSATFSTGIGYTLSPQVVTARFNGSSSFARSGETQSANGNPGSATLSGGIRIGAFTAALAGFVGAVSEFLAYGNLTTSQILAVERYLRTKWGIA
jgi:hypothetical protein